MAFINVKQKLIQVKIVYYGPGRGGKTTNLEYIYSRYKGNHTSQMISIKTEGDRTLFFDFLPFNMGKIAGYDTVIQLYTVPGQAKYEATRRLVLRGVDGIVFVADSLKEREEENIESFKGLIENLCYYQRDIKDIPLVFQYNKRDLQEQGFQLIPIITLQEQLNKELKAPAFEASALKGFNVIKTLKHIVLATMEVLQKELE